MSQFGPEIHIGVAVRRRRRRGEVDNVVREKEETGEMNREDLGIKQTKTYNVPDMSGLLDGFVQWSNNILS